MFDKYLYALGRGVRGVRKALDEERARPAPDPQADPAEKARDITPHKAPSGDAANRDAQQRGKEVEDLVLPREQLTVGVRPLVMGIVNVTPDSFSDGGKHADPASAVAHALALKQDGADIIDIGGESTRPGAEPVSEADERARVIPVVRAIATRISTPLSVDTMKAKVASEAIEAGATMVNDVWGFQRDADMARVVADAKVHCVLMHNRVHDDPNVDMYAEVKDFLSRSLDIALAAGIARQRIILDPGIGFGKTHLQSMELIRRLGELRKALECPLLLGVSRKRFIGQATGRTKASERDAGSVGVNMFGILNGADIVRVHNVRDHADAMRAIRAVLHPKDGA